MAINERILGSSDNTMSNMSLTSGTPVFDTNGNKVGTVGEDGAQGGYLMIQKGFFFPKDMYVPLNTITSSDTDGVYLSVTKAEIEAGTWEAPAQTDTSETLVTDETIIDRGPRTSATMGSVDQSDEITVPVRAEELVTGTREQEMGRVHVHKDVISEQQTIRAPVTHEQVTVERTPVNRELTNEDMDADTFVEKNIDIPVMGEELVAGKRTVVTEEVRLHKQDVTEDQQISDTVRRERVTVDGVEDGRSNKKS